MKFLLIDDHPLVREGVRHALHALDAQVEVHEAGDARAAFDLLAQHADADVALLDLGLPGVGKFEVLEELRARGNLVPVVVLSASCERSDVVTSLNLGAAGFIPKLSPRDVMLQALRLVLAGGVYIPPQVLDATAPVATDGLAADPRTLEELGFTERQRQVLERMAQGKPNKIIAAELKIAEATVKAHVTEILRTLRVTNRSQAIIVARRFGVS